MRKKMENFVKIEKQETKNHKLVPRVLVGN